MLLFEKLFKRKADQNPQPDWDFDRRVNRFERVFQRIPRAARP